MALAWGFLAGTVTRVALTLAVRRDHLRLRPGFRHWRDVLQFGGWLTVAGVFGTITAEGRKLLLGGLINPGAVALFERAQQLPQMSRQALFAPVGRVLLPSFSKNIREGVSIGPGVEMYVAAATAIIWPAFLTLGFLAVPITVLLFGENWRVAGEILPYILGSAAILVALPQPEQVLTPHGAVRRLAAVRFVQVTTALSLGALGAMHSLELFVALNILTTTIFSLVVYLSIRSLMGTSVRRMAPFYAKAVLLTVICAAPAYLAYLQYGTSVPIVVLVMACCAAVLIWIGGLFILRHPLWAEMRHLISSVRIRMALAK
jgi:O-antigen/teichoic acid export membrane protein